MSLPRPLPCAFYRTTGSNEPVREWLKALPDGKRKQVGCDIRWALKAERRVPPIPRVA